MGTYEMSYIHKKHTDSAFNGANFATMSQFRTMVMLILLVNKNLKPNTKMGGFS
jgi:hypothetical protein